MQLFKGDKFQPQAAKCEICTINKKGSYDTQNIIVNGIADRS